MSDTKPQSRVVLSIPLTPSLKSELTARAGAKPLSLYAREILFPANDNGLIARRRPRRASQWEAKAGAALLAKIGQLELAGSLRGLHQLAKIDALPVTPEVEAVLLQACADVAEIKSLLMTALGIRER